MNSSSRRRDEPDNYLQEKDLDFNQLQSLIGLRYAKDWWYGQCLEYPLMNLEGRITGYERIYPRGLLHRKNPERFSPRDNKKVTRGTRVSESFSLIGVTLSDLSDYSGRLWVIGGMADAVNVHLATGEPVIGIVGENNARSVVHRLTERWPNLAENLVVALDHDLAGISACLRTGCQWAVPEQFGQDWSDVRNAAGFDALKRQLTNTREPVQPVDLRTVNHGARLVSADFLCGDFLNGLKQLGEASNEQAAAVLALAVVYRFNQKVPVVYDENSFMQSIHMANPFYLHPDTLAQIKKNLSDFCRHREQSVHRLTEIKPTTKRSLGDSYVAVDAVASKDLLIQKDQITLVKAPYASGKTQMMSEVVQSAQSNGGRILAVTHLVSLAHELQKRLGLESYLEIPESFMSAVDGLVTCVNSLCAPNVEQFLQRGPLDVLLLDEFTQHIGVLGTSPFIKDPKVLASYLDLIEKTSTVVICDADLSSHHVDLLREWFPERKICLYEVPFTKNSDEQLPCDFSVGKASASSVVEHRLMPAIARGEKIAIATDNRKYANKLESMIKRQLPDVDLLLIDGINRNEPKQRAFLQNSTEQAEKYQVIIYTPAIQSGLSITAQFQQVFGFSHNIVLPTDFVQMLRRFRTATHFTVVADMAARAHGNSDPLSRVKALQHATRYTVQRSDIFVGEYDFFCEREKARQVDLRSLGANGLYILMQNRGFALQKRTADKATDLFNNQWKAVTVEIEQHEITALMQAPIVTGDQYDQLSHKAEPSKAETLSCQRFRLCSELGIEPSGLSEQDVRFWMDVGLTRLRRFMSFPQSDGSNYQAVADKEETPICHWRFEEVAVKVYRDLLSPLFPDWDYSRSWTEKEANEVLDKVEAWQAEAPFMLNQLRLIPDSVIKNTKQGTQFHRPKHACNFVNNLLRMAGLAIASQQVRTGDFDSETGREKRVRCYRIDQGSRAVMASYARSRAVYKGIGLSHVGDERLRECKSVTPVAGVKSYDIRKQPAISEERATPKLFSFCEYGGRSLTVAIQPAGCERVCHK